VTWILETLSRHEEEVLRVYIPVALRYTLEQSEVCSAGEPG
jgi:hypothetical protein